MIKIEYIDEQEDVYDITVEDNHNFFANGILVHNCQEIALPTKELDDYMIQKVRFPYVLFQRLI